LRPSINKNLFFNDNSKISMRIQNNILFIINESQ